MDKPAVSYTPHTDFSLKAELSALASVYRFVLERHGMKKATRPDGPDDAEGSEYDRTATPNYTR